MQSKIQAVAYMSAVARFVLLGYDNIVHRYLSDFTYYMRYKILTKRAYMEQ